MYHHAHGVSTTHIQDPTAIRNFEDGEVYASTPVAALDNSPSRLTWADQASSGEFIPKKALDLEEEYGGFSVNSDFLIESVNQSTEEVINGGCNTGGAEQGLRGTGRSDTIPEIKPTVGGQEGVACPSVNISRSDTTCSSTLNISLQGQDSLLVDMDPPLLLKAIATPCAAPTGGGHSSDIDSCAVTINPQFTTLASPSSMDKTDASQHDGRMLPSARVACPSAKTSYLDIAYASTPNISLQGPLAPSVNTQSSNGPIVTKGEWRVVSNRGKTVQEVPLPISPPATTQLGIVAIANVGEMAAHEVIESSQPYGPKPSNRLTDSSSIGPILEDPVWQQQIIIRSPTNQVVDMDSAQEQIPLPSSHKAGIVSLSLEDANLDRHLQIVNSP
ncbi:hypothetical protein F0562_034138 [Nyssa sinensis]|uniref:Uncharacterized protein n=1 Tax=Nyssa sinensis TaxID=561372 RepID=A0A5J5AIQ2_9ASTE|nr:hypothetical protein F0562_034138 [Nyssa sinensis]